MKEELGGGDPNAGESVFSTWVAGLSDLKDAPKVLEASKIELTDSQIEAKAQHYWGRNLTDPDNYDAKIAKDSGWLDEQGRITDLGKIEISRRYAEERVIAVQASVVERIGGKKSKKSGDRQIRKQVENGPVEDIRIILVNKLQIPEDLIRVYRGDQTDHYEVQVFSPNKVGGNSRIEPIRTYRGTVAQIGNILDRFGYTLVSELQEHGVIFDGRRSV